MNISVQCSGMQYFDLDIDIDFRHIDMYGSRLCLLLYTLLVYGILQNVKGIKTIFVELIKFVYDCIQYM